jgi:hypothetical protein
MLQIIRQLAKYGPITIEVSQRQWRVGCLVRLPGRAQEGFVKCYGDKLYESLARLLALAKEEHKRLWEVQRAPKQGEFEYGTNNPDWKEIA